MLSRTLLFVLGSFALLAGLMLVFLWYHASAVPPPSVVKQVPTQFILVAARPIGAGTLLRPGDVAWAEIAGASVVGANFVRGTSTEADVLGTVTRRAFAAQEPLTEISLVKPGDREFLVAALRPGFRAISIAVDAAQSAAGLVMPGDRVDVMLTQNFPAPKTDASRKSVGETVLRDLRVIAVDQTVSLPPKVAGAAAAVTDSKIPKTVTLEVTQRQAAALLVAEQLGKIQLALRGQRSPGADPATIEEDVPPTWASDVSPALAAPEKAAPAGTHGAIEVIHGGKIERRCATEAGVSPCP